MRSPIPSSVRQRVRRFRVLGAACGMAMASAGCGDTAQAPTAPAAEPAVAATAAAAPFFRIVTSGGWHSCGLTTDNVAYCWGLNTDGQLGDGTKIDRVRPVAVARNLRFTDLSASDFHTCGLATDSLVYCWGSNSNGQVGDGTLGHRLTPAKVGSRHYKQVNTGGFHSCAVTAANRAYCWGKNSQGQLGDGTTTQRLLPVPVAGSVRFRRIVAGAAHTCGVTAANKGYCWGDNGFRKLGDGSTVSKRLVPTAVAGGLSFRQVSAGNDHTCGLAEDQRAYCWGHNDVGQVGDGTRTDRPTPRLVAGGRAYGHLVAGAIHSCGVTTGHVAFCWGDNFAGKLGDGTMAADRVAPTAVAGGLSFSGVDPGTSASCGVTTAHRAYCWGHNAYGQVGIGTNSGPLSCDGIPCATKPQAVVGP